MLSERTSAGSAIMYGKNNITVHKILFLDKSPKKVDVFAPNLQYILSLHGVLQDKTNKTLVLK